jgi:pyruvate ferredoxin oxidoreductase alpha subunit
MYGKADGVKVINYIYGLGGRDVGVYEVKQVYDHLQKIADSGQIDNLYNYLGIRE